MRVGLIGTGAIAGLHARAYHNIGFDLRACTDAHPDFGRKFAREHGCEFVEDYRELCARPDIDYVDVCTFPDVRLGPVEAAAAHGKSIQVQKPMATTLETARRMLEVANAAHIRLGVVSQHRFDESSQFLHRAIRDGRLGTLLQCDAYVKWYRTDEYYSRPIKGSWATEGGGALMNQAIHQVDLVRWWAGPVDTVYAAWQIGAAHRIESEDVVSAVVRYANGATGVIQAATAFQPGYPERLELHGTRGTAIVTGDRLTSWDVPDDGGEPPPVATDVASGASDPLAISLEPFERQFRDFADAVATGRDPLVSGVEGYHALALVEAIYQSCRSGAPVKVDERAK
ncbi:MAG TPA: Gfo/Idh/MocA family oxidoreductase [Vicinamibacterales bacterium]|nr:Gfo/Idh/MocA family oxidoreductase [Vicinamibacterales bacterium]